MGKVKLSFFAIPLTLVIVFTLWFIGKVQFSQPQKVLGLKEEKDYLLVKNSPINPLVIDQTINLGNQRQLASVYYLARSLSGLVLIDYQNNFLEWLPEAKIVPTIPPSRSEAPGDHLQWLRFDELDDVYTTGRELLVQYANPGTAGVHPFYLYSYDGRHFELLVKLIEASNQVEIRDLDGVWPDEIIHSYSISGIGNRERNLLRFKDIWRLQDGKPIKINHLFPQEYQELIDLHTLALTKKEWEPDVGFYYPVLRCLREKAELTFQGKETDITECQEILKKKYGDSDE